MFPFVPCSLRFKLIDKKFVFFKIELLTLVERGNDTANSILEPSSYVGEGRKPEI